MENINTIMSTVIMVSFIVTIVLAIGSYWAYKLRERRKPKGKRVEDEAPVYFERIYPARAASAPTPVTDGSVTGNDATAA